jgi:hypothetical protein
VVLFALPFVWSAVPPGASPHIRGVTFDAPRPPEPGALEHLRDLGVTHLTLVSFGFQETINTPSIRFNPEGRWFSESDRGIRTLTEQARAHGLSVVLTPHLWLGGGAWRAEIDFDTEADWLAWEASYRTFVMHYARLAQDVGAAMLIIGTELANPVRQRPAFWRALIHEVRRVYDGEVTYAANWYEEYEHVTFWEDLDYIGVQAYFPLSEHESPSLDAIKAGWKPHQSALAALHEKTGRPILFTEIGYRSVPYAAIEPWRWLARDEPGQVEPDYELQARLYQAFFERCWHQPWLSGVFVWKWYGSTGRRGRDRHTLDFTPQDKPAEQVIGSWFTQF